MSSGLYSGVSGLALGVGLNRGVSGLWGGASGLDAGFGSFSPQTALFSAGEPGAWYDPSDVANLNWRRNVLTWTQELDNAVWTKTNAFVQANLLTFSEQLDFAIWDKTASVTANSLVAPDGATTADLVSTVANFQYVRQLVTATANAAHTLSFYVKPVSGSTTVRLLLTDATQTEVAGSNFDLVGAGSLGTLFQVGTGVVTSRTVTQLANGWYRCTVSGTVNTTGLYGYIDNHSNGTMSFGVWGAQLVQGVAAGDYQPTTSTAAAAVQYVAPDGTLTAERVTATAASGSIRQLVFFPAGTQTFSVWLRRVSGTGVIRIATDNFFTTVISVTSSWTRFSMPITRPAADNNIPGVIIETSGDVIEMWGAQYEFNASSPTDYQRITELNVELLARFPNTTMWQDSQGTTLVAAPSQPNGLILDKRIGTRTQVFNDANVTFTGPVANTTRVSSGVYAYARDGAGIGAVVFGGLTSGRSYLVSMQISAYSGPVLGQTAIRADFIDALGAGIRTFVSTAGTYTFYYLANGTNFSIRSGGGGGGTISNVSILDVPGNHATQPTAASRPTYGIVPATGRRNLLTFTEEFDNAVWQPAIAGTGATPVRTANFATAPDGTQTADRLQCSLAGGVTAGDQSRISQGNIATASGMTYVFSVWVRLNAGTSAVVSLQHSGAGTTSFTVTNQWQRLSLSGVINLTLAGVWIGVRGAQFPVNSDTVDLLVWGAQLEFGSTATTYQCVVTGFEVTETGVPSASYLQTDGTDDFLLTPTITPGTDKAQVFAGVRKLGTSAAILAEFSANAGTNLGSFYVVAPDSAAEYSAASHGSAGIAVNQASSVIGVGQSPDTAVISTLADIAADSTIIRRNGIASPAGTGDQGTGNYLAYPLYIGRRAGTTLPFNGQIFSLIVRFGANLPAATVTQTETWVGQRVAPTVNVPLWQSLTVYDRFEDTVLDRANETIEVR